jgi:hypothetical protein
MQSLVFIFYNIIAKDYSISTEYSNNICNIYEKETYALCITRVT